MTDGFNLGRISAVPRQFGIISRDEHSRRRRLQFGKSVCFACQRRVSCLCVDCAIRKVHLIDMRAKQVEWNKRRDRCVSEINAVLREQLTLEETLHDVRECMASFNIKRTDLTQRIHRKETELKDISTRLEHHLKCHDDLKTRCDRQEEAILRHPENKRRELDEKKTELAFLRRQLAAEIFSQVFPITVCKGTCCNYLYGFKGLKKDDTKPFTFSRIESKKIDSLKDDLTAHNKDSTSKMVDVESDRDKTSSDEDPFNKWEMLELPGSETKPVQTAVRYTIGVCCVNDNGLYELKEWLRTGLPQLRAYHAAFAAILNGFQLLDLFPRLFDILLPFKIAMRDVALCEKWTDDLFDTDIFKLNLSVFLFCSKIGVQNLDLHRPFANLLNLSKAIVNSIPLEIHPLPVSPEALKGMEETYKKLKKWEERESPKYAEEWCIVDSEELTRK